jgi:hypothetical protein
MRRTSLLLGALLLSGRTVSAQTMTAPSPMTPQPSPPAALHPAGATILPSTAPADVPAVVTENLTPFEGSRAKLIWQDRTWKLAVDGVVVKDFGRRESDARAALRLVQELHLTQHGTVGEPAPVMEYWLSDGHAPQGLAPGVRPLAIDTSSLKVEESQGQWVLRDRQRVWFNFGPRGDEAGRALAVMQKHHFTQAAILGSPSPTMMVFLANPVQAGSGATTFKPPKTLPTDPAAALAGYASAALPPLKHAATQPNQPVMPFHDGPIDKLPVPHASFLRGAPPEAPGITERVSFDWRQAQVRQEQGHWKLAAGSHVIADFGTNQHTATEALKAVQYYRFTEQCQVGRPTPYCSYFLANGQAPRGVPLGVQAQPIDVAHLQVQKVGDKYALVTAGQPILQFGPRPDEARHMVDVIQRHRFDVVCHVGGPEEKGLTFLARSR